MSRIRWSTAVAALMIGIAACGGGSEATDEPASTGGDAGQGDAALILGGGPIVVSDGNLEITIATVRDVGDSRAMVDGVLRVDSAMSSTHTILEFPLTVEVVDGDQWGLAFESLAVTTPTGSEVEVAFVCSSSFCGSETSSFGVFAGSPAEFTLYAIAESGVDGFDLEFAGAIAWPPADAGTPEAPEAPADTVVEVTP